MRRRLPTHWRVPVVAACLASLLCPVSAPADSVCQEFDQTVPVLLGEARMRATLCAPGSATTVVVMVAGSTYNGTYWDLPYQPEKYNFRRAMNAAGYATLVVDRWGTGASSVPLGARLTTFVQAGAVHEVIQSLRAGRIGGRAFDKVVLAGHSLGSTVVILESATYRDVDGVVVTGLTHHLNLATAVKVVASMYPAALDPQLRGRPAAAVRPGRDELRERPPRTRGRTRREPASRCAPIPTTGPDVG